VGGQQTDPVQEAPTDPGIALDAEDYRADADDIAAAIASLYPDIDLSARVALQDLVSDAASATYGRVDVAMTDAEIAALFVDQVARAYARMDDDSLDAIATNARFDSSDIQGEIARAAERVFF